MQTYKLKFQRGFLEPQESPPNHAPDSLHKTFTYALPIQKEKLAKTVLKVVNHTYAEQCLSQNSSLITGVKEFSITVDNHAPLTLHLFISAVLKATLF